MWNRLKSLCNKGIEEEETKYDNSVLDSWTLYAKNHIFTFFKEENERDWQGPFYFIQAADIQLGMIQRNIYHNPIPDWETELILIEKAVTKVNNMKPQPRFFVVCGNLCDAKPDEEPIVRKKQETDFKRVFGKLDADIPLICIGGNHDFGDNPTPYTIQAFRASFGEDYFSFWCGGILFLVINTQYFYDNTNVPTESQEHSVWLDEQLHKAKENRVKRIVLFQHIPWFLQKPDKQDLGAYSCVDIDIRLSWLQKLKDSGVEHVFCGHYYSNKDVSFTGINMTITAAMGGQMGKDPSGVRVVQILEEGMNHAYYSLDNIPKHFV